MIRLITDRKHRNLIKLYAAQLISQFGDRVHQMALIKLVHEIMPGSGLALAQLTTFAIIPAFIIQPFAGVFVDRWNKKKTLVVCDLSRSFLVLLIPFFFIKTQSMVPVYCLVFAIYSFTRFYVPTRLAIIPDLVAEEDLHAANSLMSTSGMIAGALGALVGAVYVEKMGAASGFVMDAGTYFCSALLILVLAFKYTKSSRKEKLGEKIKVIKEIEINYWLEIKEGFSYLFSHKEIRFFVGILFFLFGSCGAVYIGLVVFIQDAFQSATMDLGFMAVTLGIGALIGAGLYGRFGKRFKWDKVIMCSLSFAGMVIILFACLITQVPSKPVAMFLSGLLGLVIGPIVIAGNTMTHLVSDESMRGRVFSAFEVIIHLSFLVTMLLSSWIAQFVPEFWILVAVGAAMGLIGLAGALRPSRPVQGQK